MLKKSKPKYGKLSLFEKAVTFLNKFWPQVIILSSLVVLASLFFPSGESLKYSYQLIKDVPSVDLVLFGRKAIQFYKKFDFVLHKRKQTFQLLKKYWNISSKQIENSVVLEKRIISP